ncbi:MAG TPA: hypothetical protein GX745_08505 [Clostridiales bacterium]|nr:hypothetical protein [Clostridiales bacterium]
MLPNIDRLPTKPNRYAVYDDSHNFIRHEYHERADEPLVEGSPLNKAKLDEFLAASGETSGTASALTLAQPGFLLKDGATVRIKLHTDMADGATLDVNGTGAKSIKTMEGSAVQSFKAGCWLHLIYSSTLDAYGVQASDSVPVGSVTTAFYGTPPAGYVAALGGEVSIEDYPRLFQLFGYDFNPASSLNGKISTNGLVFDSMFSNTVSVRFLSDDGMFVEGRASVTSTNTYPVTTYGTNIGYHRSSSTHRMNVLKVDKINKTISMTALPMPTEFWGDAGYAIYNDTFLFDVGGSTINPDLVKSVRTYSISMPNGALTKVQEMTHSRDLERPTCIVFQDILYAFSPVASGTSTRYCAFRINTSTGEVSRIQNTTITGLGGASGGNAGSGVHRVGDYMFCNNSNGGIFRLTVNTSNGSLSATTVITTEGESVVGAYSDLNLLYTTHAIYEVNQSTGAVTKIQDSKIQERTPGTFSLPNIGNRGLWIPSTVADVGLGTTSLAGGGNSKTVNIFPCIKY